MTNPLTAFVTGADRGLGRALVDEFSRRGLRVFAGIHTKDTPEKAPFASELVVPILLEVADERSAARAAAEIARRSESIDILVNNAARLGEIEQPVDGRPDFDDMLRTLDVNSLGPLRVIHASMALIRRGRLRSVVNISSEAGSIAGQGERQACLGYCMSKAALNMATVLCRNRLAAEGFHFALVHPGHLKTYMHGAKNEAAHFEPEEVAGFICDVALRPEEFGRLAPGGVPFLDYAGKPLPW
jgi:NAD(P)-dependent dehydrogenase (short-subunit alcohol dehydrogenase family)